MSPQKSASWSIRQESQHQTEVRKTDVWRFHTYNNVTLNEERLDVG